MGLRPTSYHFGAHIPSCVVYLDQEKHIPCSVWQQIPETTSLQELLMGSRLWMDHDRHSSRNVKSFTPLQHTEQIEAAHQIKIFFRYSYWIDSDETINRSESTSDNKAIVSMFKKIKGLLQAEAERTNINIHTKIDAYQTGALKYWNSSYSATDKFILFPIKK